MTTADTTPILTTRRTLKVASGRVLAGAAITLAVYGVLVFVVTGNTEYFVEDYLLHMAIPACGFGLLAWLALPRQSDNGSVWVAAWTGFFNGLGLAGYATCVLVGQMRGIDMSYESLYGGVAPADLPFSVAAFYPLIGFVLIGYFLILTLGLLLFPDGELPGPAWRWVAWSAIPVTTWFAVAAASHWAPGSSVPYNAASTELVGFGQSMAIAFPILLLLAGLSLVSLVIRYRASSGVTRQQYRWIGWAGGLFVVALVVAVGATPVTPAVGSEGLVRRFVILAGISVLVGSYGVAVARYRLYDIDLVISRTVVVVVLGGFITLVYALIAVGLGRLIGGSGGWGLPVVATAVVAVAFEPIRQRAQRWANRVAYGRRATPYEVLADLTERLADSEVGAGLLDRMAALIGAGTGADRVTIWLGEPVAMTPAAVWPEGEIVGNVLAPGSGGVFPVLHDGEEVGTIEVVKARESPLSPTEKALVADLAGSAGMVLGYQRLNDSLARRAHELEESRLRLVGAQDQERRRLERDLHDGAQQLIVALKVKIGLASRLAATSGATELRDLLDTLGDETQAALDEVRALAKGIYPPVLESDGLAAALHGLAAGSPVDLQVDVDAVGRYPRDVEAAVYFDVSEAVTNAVKHAEPPIIVGLSETDGVLSFVVGDSGPGFDPSTTNGGSGLGSMADRLDALGGRLWIESRPGSPTEVFGEIRLQDVTA
ncbi:MAG: histidine kinase [Acidimicrobiia bacterium]